MLNFDLAKIEKAFRTYSDQGKQYLLYFHVPGLVWSETERACSWCGHHVENFSDIIRRKDECLFCSYSIRVKGSEVYRGSSIKPFSRGLVHLAVMYNNPKAFGLTYADLNRPDFIVKICVHGSKIYSEEARKANECAEIAAFRPLLMKCDGSDEMLDIKQRRAAMKAAGLV